MNIKIALFLVTSIWVSSAHAGFYKCTVDGTTTFSDKPCDGVVEEIDVKPAGRINGSDYGSNDQDLKASNELASSLEKNRKKRTLKRQIKATEVQINRAKRKNEREIEKLRLKKASAKNNTAGATYENSVSNEMIAMSKQYEVEVRRLNQKLLRLQDRLNALEE